MGFCYGNVVVNRVTEGPKNYCVVACGCVPVSYCAQRFTRRDPDVVTLRGIYAQQLLSGRQAWDMPHFWSAVKLEIEI